MLFWPFLFSCNPESSQDKEDTENVQAAPEFPDSLQFDFEPEWEQDELFEKIDGLFTLGVPNPAPFISLFKALYDEGGNPICPGTNYNFDSPEVSNYGCTASSGMFFAGAAEFQRDTESEVDMHCDCRIVAPDGRMVRGAGNFRMEKRNNEIFFDVQGSFIATPSEAWLEELPSIHFRIWKSGFNNTNIEGGWTINNTTIYFDNFWTNECPNGHGSIFLRDPSGLWWEWNLKPDCTQELYFNDVLQGNVEHDTTILLQKIEEILE